MLYSSTTNTANILVRGRDVLTAEGLLRAPLDSGSEDSDAEEIAASIASHTGAHEKDPFRD